MWFAGNIADDRFNQKKNYLGEWSKDKLFNELTEYGNLVLLSDGEHILWSAWRHLLQVLESSFVSGVKSNLDTSKEFITVIPEKKINDIEYVEQKIVENRKYSIEHRDEIREYGSLTFDWVNVLSKHYIPAVENVIANHGS